MFTGSSPGNVRNVAETVSNMLTATSKQSHYQQQSLTSLNIDVNVETHGGSSIKDVHPSSMEEFLSFLSQKIQILKMKKFDFVTDVDRFPDINTKKCSRKSIRNKKSQKERVDV